MADQLVEKIRVARWRCRKDLFYLARHVLQYPDIDREIHGPMLNHLQKFPIPPRHEWDTYDHYIETAGKWKYKPLLPFTKLEGPRHRLILDFRGALKTTINIVCHTIQWILNYPDITILIVHAKAEIAEKKLEEIKGHFQYNSLFRELFPDLCPSTRMRNWGNRQQFTLPSITSLRRSEPTVAVNSLEGKVAGTHVDVIKFTDIVEEENTNTKSQMDSVVFKFALYRNVLVAPNRWFDVEGTRYHFYDLYGRLIDAEEKRRKEGLPPIYSIYLRGIYKRNTGDKPPQFTSMEADLPALVDDNGQKVSWWPDRFPSSAMEEEEKDPVAGGWAFACQRLNNPVDTSEERPFPEGLIQWVSRPVFRMIPIAYYTTSVDTAETMGRKSDFTAITTCGWDRNGRCFVADVRWGRMPVDELVKNLFEVNLLYKPRDIKIEETGYVRGLKPSIRRQEDLAGIYLPLSFIKRDNQMGKTERILMTLQPWFKRKDIRFVDDITCKEALVQELTRFPNYHDDILDTLADQFQGREWFGRERARVSPIIGMMEEQERRINPPMFPDPWYEHTQRPADPYYDKTGGL